MIAGVGQGYITTTPIQLAIMTAMIANNGEINGLRLLRPETVEILSKVQWEGICGTTNTPRRFGLGFLHNCPPSVPMGTNMKAFGHPGSGGALGFCDIENNRSFGFCTNFQPAGHAHIYSTIICEGRRQRSKNEGGAGDVYA